MPNKATGSKKIPEASNIENELVRGGMTGKQTSESRGADSVTTAAVNYVENQVFFNSWKLVHRVTHKDTLKPVSHELTVLLFSL